MRGIKNLALRIKDSFPASSIDTLIQTFDPFYLQRPIPRDERTATRFREYKNIGNSRYSTIFSLYDIFVQHRYVDLLLSQKNRQPLILFGDWKILGNSQNLVYTSQRVSFRVDQIFSMKRCCERDKRISHIYQDIKIYRSNHVQFA